MLGEGLMLDYGLMLGVNKRLMLAGSVMMVGSLLPDVRRVVIINMRNLFFILS